MQFDWWKNAKDQPLGVEGNNVLACSASGALFGCVTACIGRGLFMQADDMPGCPPVMLAVLYIRIGERKGGGGRPIECVLPREARPGKRPRAAK